MKKKLNLEKLNAYYERIKNYIDNHELTDLEFTTYYMIFKEFVYSGLFSIDKLKEFAQSLLKKKLQNENNELIKKYCIELENFVQFLDSDEKKKEFEESIVKKFRNR